MRFFLFLADFFWRSIKLGLTSFQPMFFTNFLVKDITSGVLSDLKGKLGRSPLNMPMSQSLNSS